MACIKGPGSGPDAVLSPSPAPAAQPQAWGFPCPHLSPGTFPATSMAFLRGSVAELSGNPALYLGLGENSPGLSFPS